MSKNNYEIIFEKLETMETLKHDILKIDILKIMEENEEISNLIDYINSNDSDDYSTTITSS